MDAKKVQLLIEKSDGIKELHDKLCEAITEAKEEFAEIIALDEELKDDFEEAEIQLGFANDEIVGINLDAKRILENISKTEE